MASRSRGSRRDRKRGHRGFHDANDVGSNGDANMGREPSDAAVPGVSDRDLEEERKHYYEVAQSLLEYAICMQPEVVRRRRQVERLSPHYTELLDMSIISAKQRAFEEAVVHNQIFFDAVVHSQRESAAHPLPPPPDRSLEFVANMHKHAPTTAPRHFSKAKSTLHQLVREWGVEGAGERASCYGVLLKALQRFLPVTPENLNKQRVVCPGSGLGRLPLEVAARGYAAQGNEFSYQMLMTGNFMLNHTESAEGMTIFPWIHSPNNILRAEDAMRPVRIPDAAPYTILSAGNPGRADLSMVAGEFVEVYGKDKAEWDAVVSCFFLDTAPNIIEYLETIFAMLKPGGFLINFGPLLYHWQDPGVGDGGDKRYGESIELSYQEIRCVMIKLGFEIVQEFTAPTTYCLNVKCMMSTHFTGICFVARKPGGGPLPPPPPTPATAPGAAAAPGSPAQAPPAGVSSVANGGEPVGSGAGADAGAGVGTAGVRHGAAQPATPPGPPTAAGTPGSGADGRGVDASQPASPAPSRPGAAAASEPSGGGGGGARSQSAPAPT